MFTVAQKITVNYAGQVVWFNVCRYNTPTELQAALTKSEARDFDGKTSAYTELFKKGAECGRMHLLDSSIEAMTREASKMAFWISGRVGHNVLDQDFEDDHNAMVGHIVSALYSRSKYY